MIRLFDLLFSFVGLILLSPFLFLIAVWISLDSPGGPFFLQERVGKGGETFGLLKFRSMRPQSESQGQLTIGADERITRVGRFLRKSKLDELPQLVNVLKGDMSIVGPRPEVPKYVEMYSEEQRRVLVVRPGMTDRASMKYMDENDLLGSSKDPEYTYIHEIMPAKLELSMPYVLKPSLSAYFSIILKTIGKILS